MENSDIIITMMTAYDARLIFLSYVVAVFASYTALDLAGRVTVTQGARRKLWLIGGATAMGVGIWSMHYTGMAAMQMEAKLWYDPTLFGLSVLVAVSVSMVALWIAFRLRGETGSNAVLQKVVSAMIMGAAIVGLHFTGQAASNFTPTEKAVVAAHPMSMVENNSWLAITIGVATGLILGLALLGSFLNKRSERTIQISKEASVAH